MVFPDVVVASLTSSVTFSGCWPELTESFVSDGKVFVTLLPSLALDFFDEDGLLFTCFSGVSGVVMVGVSGSVVTVVLSCDKLLMMLDSDLDRDLILTLALRSLEFLLGDLLLTLLGWILLSSSMPLSFKRRRTSLTVDASSLSRRRVLDPSTLFLRRGVDPSTLFRRRGVGGVSPWFSDGFRDRQLCRNFSALPDKVRLGLRVEMA